MPSQATVTAKIGPGLTATAVVLPDVSSIAFVNNMTVLRIMTSGKLVDFDIYASTTVTYTISSHNVTLSVS